METLVKEKLPPVKKLPEFPLGGGNPFQWILWVCEEMRKEQGVQQPLARQLGRKL